MRFNESGGAPLSPTDFCSWEAQKGMFAIRLRVRVVKWLGSHLIESRQSSATPGELGGILLGQAHLDAGKQILLIEGFVPVPCNYGENFSDKDKWIFKEQLGRWHFGTGNKLYAVGYYRSRKPEDSGIGPQDLALAREFFANQTSVFLHIKQLPSETSIGGFLFRENGQMDRLQDLTFPYGRDTLPAAETVPPPLPSGPGGTEPLPDLQVSPPEKEDTVPAADRPGFQETGAGAVPEQRATPPAPETPLKRETALSAVPLFGPPETGSFLGEWWHAAGDVAGQLNWVRVASLTSLALALGIAGYWVFKRTGKQSDRGTFAIQGNLPPGPVRQKAGGQPEAQSIPAALALEVVKEKGLLHLRWNKDIPLIASASSGILAIKDGFRQKDVHLDPSRLRSGAFDYVHRTGDVTFRLRLTGPGGEASEWVRVVGVDRSPPRVASGERAVIKPHSRGWAGPRTRKDILIAGLGSAAPGAPTRRPSPVRSERIARVAPHGLTPPILVHNNARSAPHEDKTGVGVPDAKVPAAQGTESSSLAGPVVKPGESNRPAQGNDSVRLSAEAGPATSENEANSRESVSQPINPRSLLRITASLAPGMRPLVPAGTKVEVKLYVDKTGKVVRAEPVMKINLDPDAARLAIHAARELRFHPAQRGGQDVASETVIEFDFPDEIK